jgi:hypothetical protein
MSEPDYRRFGLYLFDADGTLRRTTVEGQPCPNRPYEWELMPNVSKEVTSSFFEIFTRRTECYLHERKAFNILPICFAVIPKPPVPQAFRISHKSKGESVDCMSHNWAFPNR